MDDNVTSDSSRSSKPVLERELSFSDIKIKEIPEGSQGNLNQESFEKMDGLQTGFQLTDEKPVSRGGLGERIAARAGFNAPRVNTEKIRSADFSFNPDVRSQCLTIYSPGLSPASLLESPVFLSNTLVQPSPTTGKFLFESSFNCNTQSNKEDFFKDINASFTFPLVSKSSAFLPPATSQVASDPYKSFTDTEVSASNNSSNSKTVESVNPVSQNKESSHLGSGCPASSSEKDNRSICEPADQRVSDTANENSEHSPPPVTQGEDGYNWRKYGQKPVKESEYPRSYYKCTHLDCKVKKKIERSSEGHIAGILYEGTHNHPKPSANRQSANVSSNPTVDFQSEIPEKMDLSNAMGGNLVWVSTQNGGAAGTTGSVEVSSSGPDELKYDNPSGALQVQNGTRFQSGEMVDASSSVLSNGGSENEEDNRTHGNVSYDESDTKRRKLDVFATEMTGATRAIREPRVVVQTTSDVDIIDDGYRWRKYGQKVVKGNPNPRSYYKCTALGCTVRKHVERASNDLNSVITTYEGKHNHDVPAARNSGHAGSGTAQQATVTQHEPRHRFERPAYAPSTGPFNFYQPPQLPGAFGHGLGNTVNPGLRFVHGKLPGMPFHPYLAQQVPSGGVRDGLSRGGPEGKSNSEPEFGLSNSSSIYQQMMNRLPLGPHM